MSFKWWIAIAVVLFGLGIALGLVTPTGGGMSGAVGQELSALQELSAMLAPFTVSTALIILLKNVSALVFSFVFSPFLLLVPVLALLVNGWLLSLVGVAVVQQKSLLFLAAGILPHGIFELPALFIGEAAALSTGALIIGALLSPERREGLKPGLKRNLRYLVIAAILMVPAAVMETFVTPLFIK
ncbi:MAG: stage II sporulation protein M [Chloroflexota bacterium]